VDFGVFVDDLAGGGDDVGEVEEAIRGGAEGAGDDVDVVFAGGGAGLGEGFVDLPSRESEGVGEVVRGEMGLGEEDDAGTGASGGADVVEGALEIFGEGASPMELNGGDLEGGHAWTSLVGVEFMKARASW